MIKNRYIIGLGTFLSLGLMGLFLSLVGTSLPQMRIYFNISIRQAGLITSVVQMGYALTCFLGGSISDLFKRNYVIMLGTFILGLGTLIFGITSSYELNLILFAILGFGAGLILSASNALVADLFNEKRGTALNIHHVFFAVGSFIGPLLVKYFIKHNKWIFTFRFYGIIMCLISIFFIFTLHPIVVNNKNDGYIKNCLVLLKNKHFVLLVVLNFFFLGIQFTEMFLLVTYLNSYKGFTISQAALVMSLFYILLAGGRVLISTVALRVDVSEILSVLTVMVSVSLFSGWITKGILCALSFALSGLFFSGIFPSILALVTGIISIEVSGTALGLMAMMGGIGGMILSYLVASISQVSGMGIGFLMLFILFSIATIIYVLGFKKYYLTR